MEQQLTGLPGGWDHGTVLWCGYSKIMSSRIIMATEFLCSRTVVQLEGQTLLWLLEQLLAVRDRLGRIKLCCLPASLALSLHLYLSTLQTRARSSSSGFLDSSCRHTLVYLYFVFTPQKLSLGFTVSTLPVE